MMISYLFSTLALPKIIPKNNGADLPHLIRLGFRTIALEIDLLLYAGPAEDMMTPTSTFDEAQREEQSAQIFEPNVCIAFATEDLV
ncbi:MAG TPA: hypothetical protein VG323_02580, partial [Thermoanaerobaculia bacterium]|nr:hypothetical protein [Thermoanaerobaculia bacterium]